MRVSLLVGILGSMERSGPSVPENLENLFVILIIISILTRNTCREKTVALATNALDEATKKSQRFSMCAVQMIESGNF